ncbi:hypothetical protein NXS19_001192 [Fusarium pseudograminearum]|nr:hypothetical protein NXS19_001192 [Fusarium pseudograminearum]
MFKEGRRYTLIEPHLCFSPQLLHKMDSPPLQIFQSVSNSPNDVDLDEFLHVQRLCSTPPNEPAQAQTCLDEIVIPAAASDEIQHKQKRQDDTQRGSELNHSRTQPRRRGIRSMSHRYPNTPSYASPPTPPNRTVSRKRGRTLTKRDDRKLLKYAKAVLVFDANSEGFLVA